jgi:hypothetical protein
MIDIAEIDDDDDDDDDDHNNNNHHHHLQGLGLLACPDLLVRRIDLDDTYLIR